MTFTTCQSDRAQYRILLILDALQYEPLSKAELVAELHICRSSVTEYLKEMGAIIVDYRRTGGGLVPLYSMRGRRKRRPVPLTNAERKALDWVKIRSDPARHEARKAYRRKVKTDVFSIAAAWAK